mmetsp:Transcript_13702/g.18271  ORF Transcript_13702/g.18271 Transcript_13702/m.18271 type:complete len:490 (+) Transcript_13702:1314-2783(+)
MIIYELGIWKNSFFGGLLIKMDIAKKTKHLCHQISETLSEEKWNEAKELLVQLSKYKGSAKLGSLQRWVRDADGARFEDVDASRSLLWLLCRIAAGEVATVIPSDIELLNVQPAWSPITVETCTQDSSAVTTPINDDEIKNILTATYVVKREKAAQRQPPNRYDLRIWASRSPLQLLSSQEACLPQGHDIPFVPGGRIIMNVLSRQECSRLLLAATALGFEHDEPLDGHERSELEISRATSAGGFACLASDSEEEEEEPQQKEEHDEKEVNKKAPGWSERSVAVVWTVDEDTNKTLFHRIAPHLPQYLDNCGDAKGHHLGTGVLTGLNSRWRFYKYHPHGTYRPHVDGAWPGSAIIDNKYVYDYYGDRHSRLTCLVYLNDDFDGGATTFYSATDNPLRLQIQGVRPRQGAILFFPHGAAQGSLIHEGSEVTTGSKYVIRTEVLYRFKSDNEVPTVAAPHSTPSTQQKMHPTSSLSKFDNTSKKRRRKRR